MRRLVVAGLMCIAPSVDAQAGPPVASVQPEARVDAIFAEGRSSLQVGGGVQIPAGHYVRIGVIGAAGTSIGDEGGLDGRIDLLGRFLFDPFRESRFGFSAGAGVGLRAAPGERVQALLIAVVDVEGRHRARGFTPTIQVGLGGGVRVGAGIRWGAAGTR